MILKLKTQFPISEGCLPSQIPLQKGKIWTSTQAKRFWTNGNSNNSEIPEIEFNNHTMTAIFYKIKTVTILLLLCLQFALAQQKGFPIHPNQVPNFDAAVKIQTNHWDAPMNRRRVVTLSGYDSVQFRNQTMHLDYYYQNFREPTLYKIFDKTFTKTNEPPLLDIPKEGRYWVRIKTKDCTLYSFWYATNAEGWKSHYLKCKPAAHLLTSIEPEDLCPEDIPSFENTLSLRRLSPSEKTTYLHPTIFDKGSYLLIFDTYQTLTYQPFQMQCYYQRDSLAPLVRFYDTPMLHPKGIPSVKITNWGVYYFELKNEACRIIRKVNFFNNKATIQKHFLYCK